MAGRSFDTATAYDLYTKTRELSETALLDYDNDELKEIQTKTEKIIRKTAEAMTPRKSNNRLLTYSASIAEMSIISDSIKEICDEINKFDE